MHARYCYSLLASAIALALPATGANAQSADGAGRTSARALDEIVVTARKQEEVLQEVPVAVSAFTQENLVERGAVDVNILAEFTPGLSFSQGFGRSTDRPVIRGQGNVLANVQFGVESGTAYFIDGVYYNGDIQALDFDTLERIEIIKGPQSALYGRNTYAGAINLVTRDPRSDRWGGHANVTLGDHGEQRYSASLDGPLGSERLLARIGARYNNYDGEYVNQATGRTVGQEQDTSVSATLLFFPTDNLSMRLNAIRREQEDGTPALFFWGADRNNCSPGFRSIGYRAGSPPNFGGYPAQDNRNQYYCGSIPASPELIWLNTDAIGPSARFPNNSFADGTAFDGLVVNETFTSLITDYYIGDSGWQISNLIGYRANYDLFGTDSDHSEAFLLFGPPGVAEPLFANTNRNDRREWSGELKIVSPTDRRLQGLAGIYYYEIDDNERDLTFAAAREGIEAGNSTGINNKAIFGALKYAFTDRMNAAFEIRYSEERKYRSEFDSAGAVTLAQIGEYSSTTPRFTVDYQLTPDAMVYGVFAQGARPGGLNGAAGAATGRPSYEQEESDNFELGFKSTLLDGRMRFNAALFLIDSKDVQVTQAISGGTGAITSIAVNQAQARTKGVELELAMLLTDHLTMSATGAYTDAKFTRGCDDFQFVLNSGGIGYTPDDFGSPECDISGNRLPLTPKTQASLLFAYDRPIGNGLDFFTTASWTHEGSKYVQVHNLAETGDANTVGLRVGVRTDAWSLALYGRNLTDEDTIPIATRWFDLRYGGCPNNPGAPCAGPSGTAAADADRGSPRAYFSSLRKGRTFGIEARYRF